MKPLHELLAQNATALPVTLTKWKYRAIFRVDDVQVGAWSAVIEIAVGG